MFAPPVLQVLSGERLHLSHGPIDVVLRAWGEPGAVRAAYAAAWARFQAILSELSDELILLRKPMDELMAMADSSRALRSSPPPLWGGDEVANHASSYPLHGPVARRMFAACVTFADVFVTPMAAVAGAVADELMAHMVAAAPISRAYVNDGGDIAVRATNGQSLEIGLAGDFALGDVPALNGRLRLTSASGVGGIATSGARGRSFSLGIADSVTILAHDAATADVAATLVANAVDVESAAIARRPARDLDPDSDLGDRPVTVSVGALTPGEITVALDRGVGRARAYRERGLIADAALMLRGHTRVVGLHHLLGASGSDAGEPCKHI